MIHNVFKAQSRHVIRKNKTLLDLAVCQGEALSDERTNTCPYCVAINNTVYYSRNKCDFTHLYCKCHYESFSLTSARVIFKREKMIYFLTSNSKKGIAHKMGFREEDADYLHQTLCSVAKMQYEQGNYILNRVDIHGQHCQIDFTLKGKRDHENEYFKCYMGCVIWPYGQILVATPLLCYDFK